MADDLRTMILKRDAKIGELMTRIDEQNSQHAEAIKSYEERLYNLQDALDTANSDFVDKCAACGKVERHQETKRIVAFLAEYSRKTQMKSIECSDEIESAILLHEHEVIKSVIEKILEKFPENEIFDDNLEDDPWDGEDEPGEY